MSRSECAPFKSCTQSTAPALLLAPSAFPLKHGDHRTIFGSYMLR